MKNDELNRTKWIPDIKRDYLIRTLSRTKRKDYENYIINAIYNQIDRLDIQPVTQQYIRRSDGKHALVDLYFPAINYGVECDEAYHINNHELDKIRVATMEEMLNAVEETSSFFLKRVRAYESMESIDHQIKEIVAEIKDLVNKNNVPSWNPYADPADIAIQSRNLEVADNLRFETIANLARCFGKDYKNMQRSYFSIGNGCYLWCPKLAIFVEGSPKPVASGWINILSNDWESIRESNDGTRQLHSIGRDCRRITFAKSKDVLGRNHYRFIGVFEYSYELSSNKENVYNRVSTDIDLNPWFIP